MKNSSKNNYSEKNNKYKNSPDSKINSKKINSSKKNNRFPLKSTKNNGVLLISMENEHVSVFGGVPIPNPQAKQVE